MHAFDLRPRIRPRLSRAPRGFTLAELLIAMALGVIVVGAVGMLFISSVTVMGAGNTLHQVSENVRGAFNTVERDLMAAYTSVERGDTKSFFGTPIGFTFVGRVSGRESYSPVPRLARVTYVVMRLGQVRNDTVDPAANGHYLPANPNYVADSIEYYEPTADANVTEETFSLIRFVESDLDNMSQFPALPAGFWPDPSLPPFETTPRWQGMAAEFAAIWSLADPPYNHSHDVVDELVDAKRCEVWIRMLADDPTVPSFWETVNGVLPPSDPNYRDPNDYVVASNIVSGTYASLEGTGFPYLPFLQAGDVPTSTEEALAMEAGYSFFHYGLARNVAWDPVTYMPYWNAADNLFYRYIPDDLGRTDLGDRPQYTRRFDLVLAQSVPILGSPLAPRIPEVVRMNFEIKYPDSTPRGKLIDLNMNQQIDLPSGVTRTAFAENG